MFFDWVIAWAITMEWMLFSRKSGRDRTNTECHVGKKDILMGHFKQLRMPDIQAV
jgi:hypothetical protein